MNTIASVDYWLVRLCDSGVEQKLHWARTLGETDVIELMNPEMALLPLEGRGCVIYFLHGRPDVVSNAGTAAVVANSLVKTDGDAVTATQTGHSAEI